MTNSEVIVIGGGPGGSTAATLLAQAGVSVTLLERAVFPRYHIGESITPSCRAIIDYIGALDKADSHGFMPKSGVLMAWGKDANWVVDWSATFGPQVRSWQVDREDFDTLLIDHAAESGVRVVQDAHVKRVVFEGARAVGVEWIAPGEIETQFTPAEFVLDASGRAGLISAQHFKNRRPHEIFRNVAIWGYWEGGELLPNSPSGGINVISSDDGWYWVIPLSNDRFSVGFVSHKTWFSERRKDFASSEEMLLAMVDASSAVRGAVASGTFQLGSVRVEQDFSYVADSFCGPGHYLLGDAACFLDPLLSTGVHLAMYSALLAAASVLALRRGDLNEEEAQAFYESLFRNAYNRLFALVGGFYHKHAGKDRYFELARTLIHEKEGQDHSGAQPDLAFGAIISGLADMREAIDTSAKGGTPLHEAGTWSPAKGMMKAAERAGALATAGTPNRSTSRSPSFADPNDLYDATSGLYLTMQPHLGVTRADAEAASEDNL